MNDEANGNGVLLQRYHGFEADALTGTADILAALLLGYSLECSL
jgi:hypothetical protein